MNTNTKMGFETPRTSRLDPDGAAATFKSTGSTTAAEMVRAALAAKRARRMGGDQRKLDAAALVALRAFREDV